MTGVSNRHRTNTEGIDLGDGESVLQNRRPGWWIWWKGILLAVLTLLAGIGSGAIVRGVIIGGAVLAYVVLSRTQSRYIVTDERIKAKAGLLSRASQYRLSDIERLTTGQSFFGRILGHGSIELRTASETVITLRGVPNYEEVADTIREQLSTREQ